MATGNTRNTISLSWESVTNANTYKLEKAESRSGPWSTVRDDINTTRHTARNLKCNTTYYFQISTWGDGVHHTRGFGPASTYDVHRKTGECPDAPPPHGVRPINTTFDSITIRWTDDSQVGTYRLEKRVGTAAPWSEVEDDSGRTQKTAENLVCNTHYSFQVSAKGTGWPYNSARFGNASTIPPITIICPTAPPPQNIEFTDTTVNSIELSWTPVTDGESYRVEYVLNGTTQRETTTDTTHTVHGLSPSTTYSFQIRTRGGGFPYSTEYGQASASRSETTDRAPIISITDWTTPIQLNRTKTLDVSVSALDPSETYAINRSYHQ